jgi:hypothetical protein
MKEVTAEEALHAFSNSTLVAGYWSASRSISFTPMEDP